LRNNKDRHRVSKRQDGGFKSIGIIQGRVSRELRAEGMLGLMKNSLATIPRRNKSLMSES